jgi:hypothetical protein
MPLVADHDEFKALAVQLGHLHVHLGHQRAGGVEHMEAAAVRLALDGLAHAVGREHQGRPRRHLGEFLDEDRALGLEVVHHVGVVHDLVPHIDGGAELGQRLLHDLDGPVHAGAEAPWFGQHNVLQRHHSTPMSCTSNRTGWPASG